MSDFLFKQSHFNNWTHYLIPHPVAECDVAFLHVKIKAASGSDKWNHHNAFTTSVLLVTLYNGDQFIFTSVRLIKYRKSSLHEEIKSVLVRNDALSFTNFC